MKRKDTLAMYAAVVTGILAFFVTGGALWALTEMMIEDVIVWAVIAFIAGIAAVMLATDNARSRSARRRHLARAYSPKHTK